MTNIASAISAGWERLVAVKAGDEEQRRLGRLFVTLMVINLGIVTALTVLFLSMQPLGLVSPYTSWIAAAFPIFFFPVGIVCIAGAHRGYLRPMVYLYVWVNLISIGLGAWFWDGVTSPAWVLYVWTVTTAGILLRPASALWFTGVVVAYFCLMLVLTLLGIYSPPLSFGVAGRAYAEITAVLIMLASTAGPLTYLNMTSLRNALESLRTEIAEREKTEAHLQQSEERYRNVFNHAGDIIFTMASDGAFISLSPSFEKLTGWTTQEWVGRVFAPIIADADVPRAFELLRRALMGESIDSFELTVLKKGGGHFIGEITVTRIKQGDEVIALCICRDISERKRAETILKESEERFRSLAASAQDAIISLDDTGHIVFWNEAATRMFGFGPHEALKRDVHLLLAPGRYLGAYRAGWPEFARTGRGAVVGKLQEISARRKDGTEFPIELSIAAVQLAGHWHALGVIRDITERKRVEERIRKLNEDLEIKVQDRTKQLVETQEELVRKEKLAVLGQVAGSVGHELRNPLGVMSNAVYYLQTMLTGADETTREYLNIIKDEITGSERIVSDLLDAVRTKPPQVAAVSVREVIEKTLQKCAIPPTVTVALEAPDTLPRLRVDAVQMQQVFRNLTTNAVEAMPEGGVLEIVGVENKADKTVTVSVRDSGRGIAPEVIGKIFHPLFTTKARGIGLGLAVVENLTKANGGSIKVESEIEKGSVFSITLPSEEAAARDKPGELASELQKNVSQP